MKHTAILIIITLLLKILLAGYFSYLSQCKDPEIAVGSFAKASGDTLSYLDPMDNLLERGEYYFQQEDRKVYAGRMPHYGIPYLFLRLFFSKSLASDLLVLIQILIAALATVFFAKLCINILKRKEAFWIGYILYLCSFNYFFNTIVLAPESLSVSFIVVFLYAFHSYWIDKNKLMFLIATICLSLAIVLKPYLAPILAVLMLIHLQRENLIKKDQLKTIAVRVLLISLPLGILIFPWFLRNALSLKKLVLTQESMTAGYNYTEADFAFRRFVASWGGDATFWDAKSPACYFKLDPPFECTFSFPEYSFANGYNIEDIEDVRANYLLLQRNYSLERDKMVVSKFDRLTSIYRAEKPFMVYIGSGFIRIKTLLWHTNNYNLPIHSSSTCYHGYQLIFKTIQFIIYILSLTLGLVGIVWLSYKKMISLIFFYLPLFLIFFFCFYFDHVEARYFSHAYPVMLLGLVATSLLIYSKIKKILTKKKVDLSETAS